MILTERRTTRLPDNPPEKTLHCGAVEIAAKNYLFQLKANARGRFVRITEKSATAFSSLIIPASGLASLHQRLGQMGLPPATPAGHSEQLGMERKQFTLALVPTPPGWSVQLTENLQGRTDALCFPVAGLANFQQRLAEMIAAEQSLPAPVVMDQPALAAPAPAVTVKSIRLPLGAQTMMLMLKEGSNGQYLQITEKTWDHFACVVISSGGLAACQAVVTEMIQAHDQLSAPAVLPEAEADYLTRQIKVRHKTFVFTLLENAAGRWLRLVEIAANRFPNQLLIPASGLAAFQQALADIMQAAAPAAVIHRTGQMQVPGQGSGAGQTFAFLLKTNDRGERFLLITELMESPTGLVPITSPLGGRGNCLKIPAENLDAFKQWVVDLCETDQQLKP